MPRNIRILKEDAWFLGVDGYQKYPICYRYVICYSLLCYLNSNGCNKELGIEALRELQNNIQNGEYFLRENFLEVFPLQDGQGFVVVDQADGIYPLVIYSENSERRNEVNVNERVSAFQASLNDIIEKYGNIFIILKDKTPDDWSKEYQENLFQAAGFTYEE